MTLPAPQSHAVINNMSPGPSAIPTPNSGSPAPMSKFSRISSAVDTPTSQGGTPVPTERSKVAFGFGMKRKAGEEAQGSPPPKKR